jgi:hypothetical protein
LSSGSDSNAQKAITEWVADREPGINNDLHILLPVDARYVPLQTGGGASSSPMLDVIILISVYCIAHIVATPLVNEKASLSGKSTLIEGGMLLAQVALRHIKACLGRFSIEDTTRLEVAAKIHSVTHNATVASATSDVLAMYVFTLFYYIRSLCYSKWPERVGREPLDLQSFVRSFKKRIKAWRIRVSEKKV